MTKTEIEGNLVRDIVYYRHDTYVNIYTNQLQIVTRNKGIYKLYTYIYGKGI